MNRAVTMSLATWESAMTVKGLLGKISKAGEEDCYGMRKWEARKRDLRNLVGK